MKKRVRDFVDTYKKPKTPEPFFGFLKVEKKNRGRDKKRQKLRKLIILNK